jgi:hypothetical protein
MMTQSGHVMTFPAGRIVGRLPMGLGVGAARREGRDAIDTGGRGQGQQQKQDNGFHGERSLMAEGQRGTGAENGYRLSRSGKTLAEHSKRHKDRHEAK